MIGRQPQIDVRYEENRIVIIDVSHSFSGYIKKICLCTCFVGDLLKACGETGLATKRFIRGHDYEGEGGRSWAGAGGGAGRAALGAGLRAGEGSRREVGGMHLRPQLWGSLVVGVPPSQPPPSTQHGPALVHLPRREQGVADGSQSHRSETRVEHAPRGSPQPCRPPGTYRRRDTKGYIVRGLKEYAEKANTLRALLKCNSHTIQLTG